MLKDCIFIERNTVYQVFQIQYISNHAGDEITIRKPYFKKKPTKSVPQLLTSCPPNINKCCYHAAYHPLNENIPF